jgi:hypothetical protein
MNPFEPNITLTIEGEEVCNPFEPSDNIEFGEGGYNSGKKLKKYKHILESQPDKKGPRDKVLNANAQRVYRNRNRDAYNENMRKLWANNKKEYENLSSESAKDKSHYGIWKENQAIANKNYRLNQQIANPSESLIQSKLKDLYKKEPVQKGRPKKGAPSKGERKDQFFNNQSNINKAKDLVIEDYKEKREKFLSEYKTKSNGEPRNLSTGTEFKGKREKGKRIENFPYKQSDYSQLYIGNDSGRQNKNKADLQTYYKSVITTKPVDSNALLDGVYPNVGSKQLKERKEKHYNNLSAGDWTLTGDFKKREEKSGKRTTNKYTYNDADTTFNPT